MLINSRVYLYPVFRFEVSTTVDFDGQQHCWRSEYLWSIFDAVSLLKFSQAWMLRLALYHVGHLIAKPKMERIGLQNGHKL